MTGLITIVFDCEDIGQAETFDREVFAKVDEATCVKVTTYQAGITVPKDDFYSEFRDLRGRSRSFMK